MKKLDIAISKAQLQSYSVSFNDKGEIVVHATIGLMTDGGKKITDYTISTHGWNAETKFELPFECYAPIQAIARGLEVIVTQHCQDAMLKLAAPEPETVVYENPF